MRLVRSFFLRDGAGAPCPVRQPQGYGEPARRINPLCRLATIAMAMLVFFAPGQGRAVAEPVRILAFGDSLTAGYNLAPGEGFVPQLQKALDEAGLDARVLDGGVSGDTTAGGLARLDWALADNPDAVILELGANDALRAIDPAATRANLAALLERLKSAGKPVLLAGMLAPPNLGPEYGEAFNRIYPELAEAYDTLFYPFFLDGVAADPALNQGDGMHPTAAGVALIVERILPDVRALIERARAQPEPAG